MTRKYLSLAAAAIVTAGLATQPVQAGGSITINVAPQTAEQHQLLRAGLFAANLAKG